MVDPGPMIDARPYPGDPGGRRSLVWAALAVAVVAVVDLAVPLLVDMFPLQGETRGGPRTMGLSVRVDGGNWSLLVLTVPGPQTPATTYVGIRGPAGNVSLPRTPWSQLTEANWTVNKVLYVPEGSSGQVLPGDRLLVDRARYPAGSSVSVEGGDGSTLWAGTLR